MPKDGRRQSYRIDLDIFNGDFNSALLAFTDEILLAKKMLCVNYSCKESELTISIQKDYSGCYNTDDEPSLYIMITGIVDSSRKR